MAGLIATIRGIPGNADIVTVNMRRGPGVNRRNTIVRKAPVGQTNLTVLDVQPDEDGNSFEGKVYHWLRLRFPDGLEAWGRDDLIDVQGDGSAFGYGDVPRRVMAFSLTRDIASIVPPTNPSTPVEPPATPAQPVPVEEPTTPAQPTPVETPTGAAEAQPDITIEINLAEVEGKQPAFNVQVTPKTEVGTERMRVNVAETMDTPEVGESARVSFNVTVIVEQAEGVAPVDVPSADAESVPQSPPDAADGSQPPEPDIATSGAVEPETPPSVLTGTPRIIVRGRNGMNLRAQASTNTDALTRLPYQTELEIQATKPGDDIGDPFSWIQVNYNGQVGWVREDFVRLSGDYTQFDLGPTDRYPAPVDGGWWVRDFNIDENNTQFIDFHKGWDIGANVGEPVLAGPRGGVVTASQFCRECGSEAASALDRGFSLNAAQVLESEAWNYGYGHYVAVRYDNDLLPESTQQLLQARNLGGAHLFVVYAHLQEIAVGGGQQLEPGQPIGTLGNSGNSSGPHIHLEVRAGQDPDAPFYSLAANLLTPKVLFTR